MIYFLFFVTTLWPLSRTFWYIYYLCMPFNFEVYITKKKALLKTVFIKVWLPGTTAYTWNEMVSVWFHHNSSKIVYLKKQWLCIKSSYYREDYIKDFYLIWIETLT